MEWYGTKSKQIAICIHTRRHSPCLHPLHGRTVKHNNIILEATRAGRGGTEEAQETVHFAAFPFFAWLSLHSFRSFPLVFSISPIN